MLTLGDRVELEDERRFVGRGQEIALFEDLLQGRLSQRLMIVHGRGGVGKSTLLRTLRRRARRAGRQVQAIDGRDGQITSRELEQWLTGSDVGEGVVLFLDTYERLASFGGYLRSELLPRLPERSLVVIAQRGEPDSGWSRDGWERLTISIMLAEVSAEEARELLRREGVLDDDVAAPVLAWAKGSPLALSVGAEAIRRGGRWAPRQLDDDPELARLLIRRLTEGELDYRPLDVMTVACVARRTDASLLGAVLPGVDGQAAAEWLQSCTFVEPLDGGLTLHELLRTALRTEIQHFRPERERELRRRIADALYQRAAAGETGLVPDLAELVENETLRWGLGGEGVVGLRADDVRPHDIEALAEARKTIPGHEATEWLETTVELLREAPRCAVVARDEADQVCGLCIAVTPRQAPAAAERDPCLGRWLAYAREHDPAGNLIIWRDSLDFTELHGQRDSRVLAIMNSAAIVRSGLANPRYAYLPIDPSNAAAVAFSRSVGARRLDGLDIRFDDRIHECHLLDYGDGGLLAAHRATVYAEIGRPVPTPGSGADATAEAPLSPEVVKDALRNLNRPLELAQSPLAAGGPPQERAASVRALLVEATEVAFGAEPGDQMLLEVVRRRYLGEPTTHEFVADTLHVSRATYFRYLRAALDRVAESVLMLRDSA